MTAASRAVGTAELTAGQRGIPEVNVQIGVDRLRGIWHSSSLVVAMIWISLEGCAARSGIKWMRMTGLGDQLRKMLRRRGFLHSQLHEPLSAEHCAHSRSRP
ncbi:hypothetical protein C0Z11_12315 [Acidipropionibacterium jensenii]|nr:hypothetical protein C0Z11_12315 [Acidipropionibacterium jensenii]